MLMIDLTDLKLQSIRKLAIESLNLMNNLVRLRKSSQDSRISSMVKFKPELREKRTSCKKLTTRNTS